MITQKKMHGFTIIEVIMVLIISSILFGIALILFSKFSSTQKGSLGRDDFNNEMILFQKVLSSDLRECKKAISLDDNSLFFVGSEDLVYEFIPDAILRKTLTAIDTFNLDYRDLTIGHIAQDKNDISFVRFNVVDGKELMPLFAQKDYDMISRYLIDLNKDEY